MTQYERLKPIFSFSPDSGDEIPTAEVLGILQTHPVQGILISGNVPFAEIQRVLEAYRPRPVRLGGFNLSRELHEQLRVAPVDFRVGPSTREVSGSMFIFVGPWLIFGGTRAYRAIRFELEVFDDLYRLLEPAPEADAHQMPTSDLKGKALLRTLMALGDDEAFLGWRVLVYQDEHERLARRGVRVFFVGVGFAALAIFALAVGAEPLGRVLAGLGAFLAAGSFLSNWTQHRLRRRTEADIWRRLGGAPAPEDADAYDFLRGTP